MPSHTRVTHQSYGSRVGNSCKGLIGGPIVMLISIIALVWNEGNTVTQHRTLSEGLKKTVSASIDKVDPNLDGKLVYIVGEATASDEVKDDKFGVSSDNAVLKLRRNVQMFQWVENKHSTTKKEAGGSSKTITTYEYTQEWKSSVISSSSFDDPSHENPAAMDFSSQTFLPKTINFGAYTLSDPLINKISWFGNLVGKISMEDIPSDNVDLDLLQPYGTHGLYKGNNPNAPNIGDLKITYEEVYGPQTVSVIAAQVGSTFAPYVAKAGHQILLLARGAVTKEEMYQRAQQEATAMAWVIRFVGFIFLYVGLNMVAKPLSVMGDVIPFVGNVIGTATSCVLFPVALVIALTVIGLSWIAYRPVLGLFLLSIVGGLIYYRYRQTRPQEPVATAEGYTILEDDDLEMNTNGAPKEQQPQPEPVQAEIPLQVASTLPAEVEPLAPPKEQES